ncbi:MAG: hypothetical protein ACP5N1_00745 [Candidatus Woesearchaeota archaeon]
MKEEVIRTGVDELLELLSNNSKIPLTEVASQLKLDAGVIQAWVDFLVEENIIGIEYKFTTPYIYLNKIIGKKSKEEIPEERYNIQFFKKKFWEKARLDNIPEKEIDMLWKNHVVQALELQKKYFFFEAQRRKILDPNKLWEQYKELIQYA